LLNCTRGGNQDRVPPRAKKSGPALIIKKEKDLFQSILLVGEERILSSRGKKGKG